MSAPGVDLNVSLSDVGPSRSLLSDGWRRFRRNKLALFGLLLGGPTPNELIGDHLLHHVAQCFERAHLGSDPLRNQDLEVRLEVARGDLAAREAGDHIRGRRRWLRAGPRWPWR